MNSIKKRRAWILLLPVLPSSAASNAAGAAEAMLPARHRAIGNCKPTPRGRAPWSETTTAELKALGLYGHRTERFSWVVGGDEESEEESEEEKEEAEKE